MGIGPGVRTRSTHPKHCSIKSQRKFWYDRIVRRPMYIVLTHTTSRGAQHQFLCRFTRRELRDVKKIFRRHGWSMNCSRAVEYGSFCAALCATIEGVPGLEKWNPEILEEAEKFILAHPRWDPETARKTCSKRRWLGLCKYLDFYGEKPYNIKTIKNRPKRSKRRNNGNREDNFEHFFREVRRLLYSSD